MLLGDHLYFNGCQGKGILIDSGTSYPGVPAAGQLFYRTDLLSLAAYDGSSWQLIADQAFVTAAVAGVGALTNTVKTADYTAIAGDMVLISNSGGSNITVDLPSSPADGDLVGVVVTGRSSTGNIGIDSGGNSFIDGSTVKTLTMVGEYAVLRFDLAGNHWLVVSGNEGALKYTSLIGDGATNPIAVTHGMGTMNVSVTVVEVATGQDAICTVARTTADIVTITFTIAPTSNQYNVIVHG